LASESYAVNNFWDCIYINRVNWPCHSARMLVMNQMHSTKKMVTIS